MTDYCNTCDHFNPGNSQCKWYCMFVEYNDKACTHYNEDDN